MVALRNMTDLSQLGLPPDQVEIVRTQVEAYWTQAAITPVFGFIERCSALMLHLGLSVIVLYSVVSGQRKFYWLALFWHALIDASAVYLFAAANASANASLAIFGLEVLIAVLGAAALAYAIRLRTKFQAKQELST